MIASVRGILTRKSPESVVVETGGVGLAVLVPLTTLYNLPDPGNEVRLIVHTHVRENEILLIGFSNTEEKETFLSLTKVSGIGPRLAVNILSGLPAEDLWAAILVQDAARLQKIPGVGKKMAERMVLELKDRIPPREVPLGPKQAILPTHKQVVLDALSALMNLGYNRRDAEDALGKALGEDTDPDRVSLEGLLREALKRLAKEK